MKGKISTIIFLIIQMILYISFLLVDLYGTNTSLSSGLKYSVIVLNLCYVLFLSKCKDKMQLNLLRIALFFTLISDLLILILDYYNYGVYTFIIVQQLYGIRLLILKRKQREGKGSLIGIWLRRFGIQLLIAVLTDIIIWLMGVKLDSLTAAAVFYFISFVYNVITAVRLAGNRRDISSILFAAGLVLFLLCDINVGLFNLSDFINISGSAYTQIYAASSILMWAFYAPSQVLIALSLER